VARANRLTNITTGILKIVIVVGGMTGENWVSKNRYFS